MTVRHRVKGLAKVKRDHIQGRVNVRHFGANLKPRSDFDELGYTGSAVHKSVLGLREQSVARHVLVHVVPESYGTPGSCTQLKSNLEAYSFPPYVWSPS